MLHPRQHFDQELFSMSIVVSRHLIVGQHPQPTRAACGHLARVSSTREDHTSACRFRMAQLLKQLCALSNWPCKRPQVLHVPPAAAQRSRTRICHIWTTCSCHTEWRDACESGTQYPFALSSQVSGSLVQKSPRPAWAISNESPLLYVTMSIHLYKTDMIQCFEVKPPGKRYIYLN